ncbi:4Fe-4S single cluster domain-containing protein [Microbacterium sp. ARD32]|uniref:4Fe-4S single cluster domain-containing protein n=1 Tax=Microbacterium sp. ARD32 TaxID=2962577 RepID=UPI00288184E8|nr:4Fe-4S single cluster domain-containing protein [Microbacterium sp. ARD32]MDT0158199.1 4Fe-4S single cluster domain-containing protein [Microbacterium sp. ARD32]
MSRVAAPVTALGPGRRVALWVQGCTIGCAGCASVDTWDPDGGRAVDLDELRARILGHAGATGAGGFTVTGGEPFQQAPALVSLIAGLREEWPGERPDVLVFTGYAAGAARRISPELWDSADVLVAGPYRADRPSGHPLLGSGNQVLHVRTEAGAKSIERHGIAPAHLQFVEQDGALHVIGMPEPGDLDRLRERLRERGISFDAVSWEAG